MENRPVRMSVLRAVGHNIADSLASGVGLPIDMRGSDVFGEAAQGAITVDFLAGTASRGSPALCAAVAAYAGLLDAFCRRHGIRSAAFAEFTARFDGQGTVTVTVGDRAGRRWRDAYVGRPLRRPEMLDPLGRRRPVAGRRIARDE